MAEAIAVVGLAASVVTFVDASAKVLARINEFRSAVEEVPSFVQDIAVQLPLLVDIMNGIRNSCKEGSVETDKLSRVVESCLRKIKQLDPLIEEMLVCPTDSKRRRAWKAIASFRKERDIEKIQSALELYKSTLTLHLSQRPVPPNAINARDHTFYEVPSLKVSQYVSRVHLMEEIENGFGSSTTNASHPKVVVLLGMGGQGKTQLALEYASKSRSAGKYQAIFWVDASSSSTVSRGFETIAAKISSTGQVFDDVEARIDFVKETLGRWDISWLIVFDNYDQPRDFKNVTEYIPQGGTGAILFTSRHGDSERLGFTVRLTRMTEDEGLRLLFQSKLEMNAENVLEGTKIIQTLGFLPLAIDQAGAYISARKLPLRQFLKHYDERRDVVLKHTPSFWEYRRRLGEGKDETLLNVFTTWELSFQHISDSEEVRARIEHFLTLSAFLDFTNISEDLFRSYTGLKDVLPEWRECFISEGVWSQYQYQDVLVELQKLSLLQTMDIGSEESRFSLHPLVAEWLRLRADQTGRHKYTIEAVNVVMKYLIVHDKGSFTFPLQARLEVLSHIDMCLQNEEEYLQNPDESDDTVLSAAALGFALLYQDFSRYQEAEAMLRRALPWYEKTLGPENRSTLDSVANLGLLCFHQARLAEAEVMYLRALTGKEKTLGPDHESTLDTVNNLGSLYFNQHKLADAEAWYQRALAGYENRLGPEHASTLSVVNNLGFLYFTQDKRADAEAMYQRALAGSEKTLGPEHTATLDTVHHLGMLYSKQDRLADGESMHRRALAGLEKTLGPEHITTLQTVNNLGNLYADQGKMADAEAMLQRALNGYEKALGPVHKWTAQTVNNLGNVYYRQGKLADAESMYQRALAGHEKTLGPEDTSTLLTVHNLGDLYADQGKLADAESMYQRALAGREKTLGPEHTETLPTVTNLGVLYYEQGKWEDAESMYQRALVGYEKTLGPDHTSTLDVLHNLGLLYCNLGVLYRDPEKLLRAEAMIQRALVGRERILGPEHMSTLDTVHNLGLLYASTGRLAEAEVTSQRALAGREKALGPDHQSTLQTARALNNLYMMQSVANEVYQLVQTVMRSH
ncbi:MAG: hypothetical protein M1816_002181 [Peltula sp. TS41687]|nr:MAG: hypothetical protein M1816_002181 [Peltula sp. TS41687]